MNLTALIAEVRALTGDPLREDPDNPGQYLQGPTKWTDTEITSALNFAQKAYCQKTLCSMDNGTFTIGQNMTGSFGAHSVSYCEYSGKSLDRSSITFESRLNPSWRTAGGTPRRWVPDGMQILVSPAAAGSVTVRHLRIPTDMATGSDTPDTAIPTAHHMALVYWAAGHLLMEGGDPQDTPKAAANMEVFGKLVGA